MNSKVGIVLASGYLGSSNDFDQLSARLVEEYGQDSVVTIVPQDWSDDRGQPRRFNADSFVEPLWDAVTGFRKAGNEIFLVGHSTGGTAILSFMKRTSFNPRLLALAATPKMVDMGRMAAWQRSNPEAAGVSLISLTGLASFINRTSREGTAVTCPVLLLYGEEDQIVPVGPPYAWQSADFQGRCRTIVLPGTGHDVFSGVRGAIGSGFVARAIADGVSRSDSPDSAGFDLLKTSEPEAERFLSDSPLAAETLARCPSMKAFRGDLQELVPRVASGPVIVNIEVTTRCNLSCLYCARQRSPSPGQSVTQKFFEYILASVPDAYRVTLVGLGEPLLHPDITGLVETGVGEGRRMGLVTNGALLTRSLSRRLLKAGLSSIAFSIDAPTEELAARLRPGAALATVLTNVRAFMEEVHAYPSVTTAVFSALSKSNVNCLEVLVDLVADLGVHALVLTDLNFPENEDHALRCNAGREERQIVRRAVALGFRRRLPVLSVHALEAFGLFDRYRDFLLVPPDSLFERRGRWSHCFSPWQTIAVNVKGEVSLCDCQPGVSLGNLSSAPLSDIWNAPAMINHRKAMLGESPPASCTICPRF